MFSKEEFVKMINDQAKNLSVDERQDMFDSMIEICYKNMTENEFESKIFKYTNRSLGGPMLDMMSAMMGRRRSRTRCNDTRRGMWRGMMEDMARPRREDSYTTDELTDLFKDWCSHVEDEIVDYIKESGEINEDKIADEFNLSTESVKHLINNLKKDAKI